MKTFILANLEPEQKHKQGVATSESIRNHPAATEVIKGLCLALLTVSTAIGQLLGLRPAVYGQKSGYVNLKAQLDRLRDQAVMAIDALFFAWSCRHDQPAVTSAVERLRTELIPTGTSFIRLGYAIESSTIKTLLERADDPKNAADILLVPSLNTFIENLRSCEKHFLEAESGRESAHSQAIRATESLSTLERRWTSAARLFCAEPLQ